MVIFSGKRRYFFGIALAILLATAFLGASSRFLGADVSSLLSAPVSFDFSVPNIAPVGSLKALVITKDGVPQQSDDMASTKVAPVAILHENEKVKEIKRDDAKEVIAITPAEEMDGAAYSSFVAAKPEDSSPPPPRTRRIC